MNNSQQSLKSWIMQNFCTQGYSMHFEELSTNQLEDFQILVRRALEAQKEVEAAKNAELSDFERGAKAMRDVYMSQKKGGNPLPEDN